MDQSGLQTLLAVDSMREDTYRYPKKLAKTIASLTTADGRPNTSAKAIGSIIGWTFDPAEEKRVEELRPPLDTLAATLPFVLHGPTSSLAESQAIEALHQDAMRSGGFTPWYGPQPEITAWIEHTVAAAQPRMLEARKNVAGPQAMGRVVLSTIFALRNMLNITSSWFVDTGSNAQKNARHIVGSGIQEIKAALEATLLCRELQRDPEMFTSEVLPVLQGYLHHHFRLYGSKLPQGAEFCEATLSAMERHREAFAAIMRCILAYGRLPEWSERLSKEVPQQASDTPMDGEPALPWGEVVLLRPGAETQQTVVYHVNAYMQLRTIAMHDDESDMSETIECTSQHDGERGIGLTHALATYRSPHQALHLHPHIDRLAPIGLGMDATMAEAIESIGSVESTLYGSLMQLWNEHPELFGMADALGLLGVVETSEGRVLLYNGSEHELVNEMFPDAPARDAAAVLRSLPGITVNGNWNALLLPGPKPSLAPSSVAVPTVEQTQSMHSDRRQHRAAIRRALGSGGRLPSLQWALERIRAFGTIECETMHGTSHQSIYFYRNGTQRRYVTGPSVRGHESLPIHILYALLRTFEIDEAAFAERWGVAAAAQ